MQHALAVTRAGDFSAWYQAVVDQADLAEESGVRGCMIIRPWGYGVWQRMQELLDRRFRDTGHENCYFPLFIPLTFIAREAEHVEGFAKEMAVVTHHRLKMIDGVLKPDPDAKLEEPLIVRPTSETVIGQAFHRWVRSHRDLPLLLNQWANVVRWEMRPRLFLRTTEFLWQEGHTAHADEAGAMAETMLALDLYADVARDVAAMPVIPGEKTPGERFAGAARTFTIEGMMRDGKAVQSGTSHYMATNFARAFDIRYASETGQRELCHTTSWGMSTRMIGAIIMAHGDDQGLVLPPGLAPYQDVIVPIGRDDQLGPVLAAAESLRQELRQQGVRVHVDQRAGLSPGFKFNDWELRGAPLRIEIGPRDLEAGVVIVAQRLGGDGKVQLRIGEAARELPGMLGAYQDFLLARATAFRDENTVSVDDWDRFQAAVAGGWARAFHCGNPACEDDIKAATAATPRCVPLEGPAETGECIRCNGVSAYGKRVLFGRAY